MAVKEWFRRLQPVQLYLVLFLTTAFFIVEIVASYVTHALTLLLNAYHMLCNIIALVGCIASIKQSRSETTMKNTFGWARFDILSMLVCCVFLASFCFSLLVEALQTLVHIDHLDEMHLPLPVMCIGAAGILLNAFCYILIGGYMFNQDIFVHVTENGDVMLRSSNFYHSIIAHGFLEDFRSTRLDRLKFDGNVHFKPVSESDPQRNAATERRSLQSTRTQGLREMFRDVLGCIFVIVTSIIVYLTDANVAKYVDPVFAIISAISLLALSYPYMKESGLILLQTIPNHINIDALKRELLRVFPEIVNVHDLHVWQLNGERVISTAHIIFLDPTGYSTIMDQVTAFFLEMGITQVTIQPEFVKMKPRMPKGRCLITCRAAYCSLSQCCTKENSLGTLPSVESGNFNQSNDSEFEKIVSNSIGTGSESLTRSKIDGIVPSELTGVERLVSSILPSQDETNVKCQIESRRLSNLSESQGENTFSNGHTGKTTHNNYADSDDAGTEKDEIGEEIITRV
ncbi:zinc transporter 1 isoform X2 [Orussus abietinus]|uniref:zinc transporter 1 isoform X2 n=1 Tax=Orussus abietinus TaxID=222816 RepID=UPI0006258797|nr:zinc transporter 1 isoform X2 [Orussus abietinus]